MSTRYAIIFLSSILFLTGCTTYSSLPLSRTPSDGIYKDTQRPVKGVPVAVKVPTHVDIYIDETYYLAKGEDDADLYKEVNLRDSNGNIRRNLGIRPKLIHTKKIFIVDFKRAAAGVTSNGLTFNDEQNLKSITGSIQDETLKDATAAFTALAPLLTAKKTSAASETTSVGNNTVRGSRVVAYKRFDISQPDFEQKVCEFVELHINACHSCAGPTSLQR